jgi:hypothetical protein
VAGAVAEVVLGVASGVVERDQVEERKFWNFFSEPKFFLQGSRWRMCLSFLGLVDPIDFKNISIIINCLSRFCKI